ncbi:MAG: hypothetical protein JZD40_03520 [Sulfolobus sp.]|nr:hypothetical protein [Sulfolobus sp.]
MSYGVPMKPTTMTIVAYYNSKPLLGISAGGIRYRDWNAIDVVFTKMMAGLKLTKTDIASIGVGGLSHNFNLTKK